MFLSCSHSREPDLPVTLPLPSSTWLSVLFPIFLSVSSFIFFSPPLCSNVPGLSRSLSDLALASSQYDILLCSETLVSDLRHMSDLVAVSSCAGASCLVPVGWRHMYEMDMEHFAKPKFECGCCEMLVVRVCGLRQNFYVYSLYHGGMINRWPHQNTSTLDDVFARNGTYEIKVNW